MNWVIQGSDGQNLTQSVHVQDRKDSSRAVRVEVKNPRKHKFYSEVSTHIGKDRLHRFIDGMLYFSLAKFLSMLRSSSKDGVYF